MGNGNYSDKYATDPTIKKAGQALKGRGAQLKRQECKASGGTMVKGKCK